MFSQCPWPLLRPCPPELAPCSPWPVTASKGSVLFESGGSGGGCGRPVAAGQHMDLADGEVSMLVPGDGPSPAGPGLHIRAPRDQLCRGGGGLVPSVSCPFSCPHLEHWPSPHTIKHCLIPQHGSNQAYWTSVSPSVKWLPHLFCAQHWPSVVGSLTLQEAPPK